MFVQLLAPWSLGAGQGHLVITTVHRIIIPGAGKPHKKDRCLIFPCLALLQSFTPGPSDSQALSNQEAVPCDGVNVYKGTRQALKALLGELKLPLQSWVCNTGRTHGHLWEQNFRGSSAFSNNVWVAAYWEGWTFGNWLRTSENL